MTSFFIFCALFSSFSHAGESLYERLGGRQTINAIVSDFVDMTLADTRVRMNSNANGYMKSCKSDKIKERLDQIVCEESGGPCEAAAAHAEMAKTMTQMALTPSDWDAMAADFSAALTKFKVPEPEQAELRQILERARARFVQH
jgi:hemoglobin